MISKNPSFVNFDNENTGTYLTCTDDEYNLSEKVDNNDDLLNALKEYNDLNIEIVDTNSSENSPIKLQKKELNNKNYKNKQIKEENV